MIFLSGQLNFRSSPFQLSLQVLVLTSEFTYNHTSLTFIFDFNFSNIDLVMVIWMAFSLKLQIKKLQKLWLVSMKYFKPLKEEFQWRNTKNKHDFVFSLFIIYVLCLTYLSRINHKKNLKIFGYECFLFYNIWQVTITWLRFSYKNLLSCLIELLYLVES